MNCVLILFWFCSASILLWFFYDSAVIMLFFCFDSDLFLLWFCWDFAVILLWHCWLLNLIWFWFCSESIQILIIKNYNNFTIILLLICSNFIKFMLYVFHDDVTLLKLNGYFFPYVCLFYFHFESSFLLQLLEWLDLQLFCLDCTKIRYFKKIKCPSSTLSDN